MQAINKREDVHFLVSLFYKSVRKDMLLGPIFNRIILEKDWPKHIEKLTDFWETNLFGIAKFKGNPVLKHQLTDQNFNYQIEQEHFGRWLQLWFQTLDDHFEGDKVEKAKNAARKMSTGLFMAMWHKKPKKA